MAIHSTGHRGANGILLDTNIFINNLMVVVGLWKKNSFMPIGTK